jgi:hypothetical protein
VVTRLLVMTRYPQAKGRRDIDAHPVKHLLALPLLRHFTDFINGLRTTSQVRGSEFGLSSLRASPWHYVCGGFDQKVHPFLVATEASPAHSDAGVISFFKRVLSFIRALWSCDFDVPTATPSIFAISS